MAKKINFSFPNFPGGNLATVVPDASSEALNIMNSMLCWDPNKRPTATQLLQHPYFQNYQINLRITTPKKTTVKPVTINGVKDQRRNSKVLMESTLKNFAGRVDDKKSSRKEMIGVKKKESSDNDILNIISNYTIKFIINRLNLFTYRHKS